VAVQKSVLANKQAVILRDKGKAKEAKALLESTANELDALAEDLDSPLLQAASAQSAADATTIEDEKNWSANRKSMVDDQYGYTNQQRY
jgi:hypothetical protein